MTSTRPDLPVPESAHYALQCVRRDDAWGRQDAVRDLAHIRAIAAPVVAAELRRLAGDHDALNWQTYRAQLLARADELDR